MCKCGACESIPADMVPRILQLRATLEIVRESISKPIIIESAVRCFDHNVFVGGVLNSEHLFGRAVDIRVEGMTGAELLKVFEALITAKRIKDGGLGTYEDRPRILHYDIGKPRRWKE